MNTFLRFIVCGLCLLSPLEAYQDQSAKEAMDAFRGTESASRLHEEFSFLEETIATLLAQGAAGPINYMWNPSHSIVVFFSVSPPSGTYHCRFWAYQKNQMTWEKLGEYDFCTSCGSDLDWNNIRITIRDEGYDLSWSDEGMDVSHFFSFAKKQDALYYKTGDSLPLAVELESLLEKLQNLRKQQAENPGDKALKDETERVKAEYHRKIIQYNHTRIPRSRLIIEGDMPPENMPWNRADGGKVSVTFTHRGKEMSVSDAEAEAVRDFLDDHVSEWIRGNLFTTEGMLNQIIFTGSVTIRKENGYSRTYTIVDGEGLRWNDCYLPLIKTYSDDLFYIIQKRYIKAGGKYPLHIAPEAR